MVIANAGSSSGALMDDVDVEGLLRRVVPSPGDLDRLRYFEH